MSQGCQLTVSQKRMSSTATCSCSCIPLSNGDIERGEVSVAVCHRSPPTDTRQGILPCKRSSSSPSSPPSAPPLKKRADYLSWEEYFMAVAFLSAQRSKDPNSQVGACIVNPEHKIVGIGYNGMPNNCSDDELPWQREAPNRLDTKYPYVCHAELNAILNKNTSDVKGCIMYVALFPCNECAKLIIQSGIAEVVFMSDKYHSKPEMVASRRLLNMAGIKYRQYIPSRRTVTIDFSCLDQSVYDVMQPYDTSLCVEETEVADIRTRNES